VICGYLLVLAIVYVVAIGGIVAAGAISKACLDGNFCSAGERFLSLAVALAVLGLSAACIAFGWRGRLIGARKAP